MRLEEYGPTEVKPLPLVHKAEDITQPQLRIQFLLMNRGAETGIEDCEREIAWATRYSGVYRNLYETEAEFRSLVDGCDGSQECLMQIQETLDRKIGHH
jgi:hypothetical protein